MAIGLTLAITELWKIIVSTVVFVSILSISFYVSNPQALQSDFLSLELAQSSQLLQKGEVLHYSDSENQPQIKKDDKGNSYISYLEDQEINEDKFKTFSIKPIEDSQGITLKTWNPNLK